jgi:acetoacetyl-CoA synthetase
MATTLWTHPYPATTNLDAFRRYVNRTYQLNLTNYNDLHTWSVTDICAFSTAVWNFCGVKHSVAPTSVGQGLDSMWPPPSWLPGARLNFTENILSVGLAACPASIAVTAIRDGKSQGEQLTFFLSWRKGRLFGRTRLGGWAWSKATEYRVSGRSFWIQYVSTVGYNFVNCIVSRLLKHSDNLLPYVISMYTDSLLAVLTNSIDCLLILLAAGCIGAIFSSTSPEMGAKGIVERFIQLRPKILLCETEIFYAGKRLDLRAKLAEAIVALEKSVPELQCVVVVSGPKLAGKIV